MTKKHTSMYRFTLALIMCCTVAVSQQGSLDITFNGSGKKFLAPTNSHDNAYSIMVQPDSNIIIVGLAIANSATGFDICATRLFPDGTLDTSYANNGYFFYDHAGKSDFGYSGALQTDGKLVICGAVSITAANTDFAAIRLNTDGSPDTSFGIGGLSIVAVNTGEDYARGLVIQPDGKIILAGYSATPGFIYNNIALVRLNTDGSLDNTFGTQGIALPNFPTQSERLESIALTATGSIVGVGYKYVNNTETGEAYGFLPNGAVDPAFGINGVYTLNSMSRANEIVERNNKLYIAGTNSSGNPMGVVAAILPNGMPLTSFGNSGTTFVINSASSLLNAITLQKDGKLIVTGNTGTSAFVTDYFVARLDTTGVLDASFGTGGKASFDLGNQTPETAYGLAIQADDKILVCGVTIQGANNDMGIIRLLANSSPVTLSDVVATNTVYVYPNPASTYFSFDTAQPLIQATLVSPEGKCFILPHMFNNTFVIPDYISAGLYTIKGTTKAGTYYAKIIRE